MSFNALEFKMLVVVGVVVRVQHSSQCAVLSCRCVDYAMLCVLCTSLATKCFFILLTECLYFFVCLVSEIIRLRLSDNY